MKSNHNHLFHRFSLAPLVFAMLCGQGSVFGEDKTIATFKGDESLKLWTSVNDGVMGGVSKGGFARSEEDTLLFRGELSLANNGGFASIRMKPSELGLNGTSAITIQARGDGRTYWVDLRSDDQMAASSYRAYLATKAGEWQETTIPFQDFKLQAFGRELPAGPIKPNSINSIGFTIADKKEGEFSLEIKSVSATSAKEASKAAEGETIVDVAKAAGNFTTLLAAATAADLAGVLSGEGPFTVLAPTDDAFAKLPAGTVESLLKPENRNQLIAILKNHVIAGKVTLAKALEAREADSLQGSKISFQFAEGRVLIGKATLLNADIMTSNGIIHAIDQVLLPQSKEMKKLSATQLIELAIDRGVPVFNEGDFDGCAAIYEVTIEALRTMKSVPEESQKILVKALAEARATQSTRDQAWILRAAIDQTWKGLQSPE
jgi:uncharacterized surface protein with fasciclin (FAS1) repeats